LVADEASKAPLESSLLTICCLNTPLLEEVLILIRDVRHQTTNLPQELVLPITKEEDTATTHVVSVQPMLHKMVPNLGGVHGRSEWCGRARKGSERSKMVYNESVWAILQPMRGLGPYQKFAAEGLRESGL